LERLARWWTSASQEERNALWLASAKGAPEAPCFEDLTLAIILAECEAGEVAEG